MTWGKKIMSGDQIFKLKFEDWWTNQDDFDYVNLSCNVAISHSKHFDEWWDGDKFNWSGGGFSSLLIYCGDYIDIWWDETKIQKRDYKFLCQYKYNQLSNWMVDKVIYNMPLELINDFCRPDYDKWFANECPDEFKLFLISKLGLKKEIV